MKDINKLRLLAGIPIDGKAEKTIVTEARDVPKRREQLAPVNEKTLTARVKNTEAAIKHLTNTIKSLEKIPATNFTGDIQHYIEELEYVLKGEESTGGLSSLLNTYKTEQRKHIRNKKLKARAEEEEIRAASIEDDNLKEGADEGKAAYEDGKKDARAGRPRKNASDIYGPYGGYYYSGYTEEEKKLSNKKKSQTTESVHTYNDNYDDWEEDETKPVNVTDGKANDKQVWDENDPKNITDESPNQLREPNKDSEQDQSTQDIEAEFRVPNSIKQALRTEIEQARKESEKLDVRDKDASYFYRDLAQAFEDLLGHLEKGTIYDMKQAQTFAQSLMGPMLHKLPTEVWKFLANGGKTRSLKSFMTDVSKKYPKIGPQNKLK